MTDLGIQASGYCYMEGTSESARKHFWHGQEAQVRLSGDTSEETKLITLLNNLINFVVPFGTP